MTLRPPFSNTTCDLIVRDLLKNRHWNSAIEISLFEHQVVVARHFYNTPIVVFIPVSENVKLFDMELVLNRVRQLGLDLSTGEVTLHTNSVEEDNTEMKGRSTNVSPLEKQSSSRFLKDDTFDRDKCLSLHNRVTETQLEFEFALEAKEQKKARYEEMRLGLIDYDSHKIGSGSERDVLLEEEASRPSSVPYADFDQTVDINISAMFAFSEGGNLCYYQATLGLAPPEYCPDDSDDEKPLEQVQKERKKTQMKRKNIE